MVEAIEEASPVGIPGIGWNEMSESWALIHDLLGGTKAMRAAGQTWLALEAAETSSAYTSRLDRSILYNGFRDTLSKLRNRPFTHPIKVTDLPGEIAYLENDVDGNKKSLQDFIKEVLESLIKYGVAHIFVDHSVVEGVVEGKQITKAEEKEAGARVFLVNVSPSNLIGWQTEKTTKTIKLTQIRIKETVIESSGEYGDIEAIYIHVHSKGAWETYKQDADNKEKYILENSGTSTFNGIPLVTIYANRIGFMTAEPTLIDLAWLNLAHWQSYSDQKNILRFSRFGLLFGKGLPKKVVERGTIQLGPTKAVLVGESEHADLKYVEHSGKSIAAGQTDIEDIEHKMRVLGNQPLIKNIPNTATAERIDEDRTVSQLQSWVRSLEQGIKQALEYACEWRKVTPPEAMAVEIYSDFEAVVLGGGDKELLLKMRSADEITSERFLKEEQRRGVFSQDMDPEEEAKQIATESADELKNLISEENLKSDEDLEEE